MIHQFYITGLPRSGTAWLSRFFSVGDSYCFHEAEARAGVPAPEEVADRMGKVMRACPSPYVGNSSSGLLLLEPDAFPAHAPVILVRRDPKEVSDSLARLGWPPESALPEGDDARFMTREGRAWVVTQTLMERLKRWEERPNTLEVAYANPFPEETLRRMWRHVRGAANPFPEVHYQEMIRLNIQLKGWVY